VRAYDCFFLQDSFDPALVGTWVAQCCLYKKLGKFIHSLKEQELIVREWRRASTLRKMCAFNSPHGRGYKFEKFTEAGEIMLECRKKLRQMDKKFFGKDDFKKKDEYEVSESEGGGTGHSAQSDLNSSLTADVCAAFLTFEYN